MQRQLQHQLEHCFPEPKEGGEAADKQRYQATLSLKNSLRERLTNHVMMQQEMLQHLDNLVSGEGGEDGAAAEVTGDAAGPERAVSTEVGPTSSTASTDGTAAVAELE